MQSARITSFEHVLIKLDSGPWHAISRVVLGFSIPPVFRAILGAHDSVWTTLALFFALLIALRVIPTLLRHNLPFSTRAKEIWAERRRMAKQYDSYQWQKLFWIGLGIAFYAVVGDGLRTSELVLAIICLISGGTGLLLWSKTSISPSAK